MIKKAYFFVLLLLPLLLNAQIKLPPNMYMQALPNGLDVLVLEDHSVPLATVMITFKSGAITETANVNGLNALYLKMFLRANRDQQDVSYYAGQLGIVSWGTSVKDELAEYNFTLPKTNLEDGLNLMNASVRFPRMAPSDIEKEKYNLIQYRKSDESNQYYPLNNAMLDHLWGDLRSRKNLEVSDAIRSATLASLDSLKSKYYYPNNSLLIIAGDVAHEDVFKLSEKIYGDWQPSGFEPLKKWPIPEFKPLTKPDYFIVESPLSKTPAILLSWQGPDTRNDIASTYTADVFLYIVNQSSSKLSRALVQSGLAFSANLSYLTSKYVGPISLFVRPNPSKIKECMAEIKKQIDLMDTDDYLADNEIVTAKRRLEINKVRTEDVTSIYVHDLSFWWASASLNYFFGYNDQLKLVTKEQLKTYIRRYIKNRPYSAGLLINPDLNAGVNANSFFTTNN